MMEPFNSLRAPVFAKNDLACSSQPLAAALGAEILRMGGNAAYAAVAMAAMVNITEPMMNGLGGDCMMLVCEIAPKGDPGKFYQNTLKWRQKLAGQRGAASTQT